MCLAAFETFGIVGMLCLITSLFFGRFWSLYSNGIFTALPILVGLLASLLLESDKERSFVDSFQTGLLAIGFSILPMLLFGVEGLVCLAMALPLGAIGVAIGVSIGRAINSAKWAAQRRNKLLVSVAVLAPFALGVDAWLPAHFQGHEVSTEFIIDAPSDRVWPLINNLSSIDNSRDWLLDLGFAHPTKTQTSGSGVGASRICRLTTGDMNEVIDGWEPNRLLRFHVLNTPACMVEMNPFGEVNSAHLTGYYRCVAGEFRLEPLPGGRTRIVATSWYEHRFGPSWYWTLWTDTIVHRVHMSVFLEIQARLRSQP